MDLMDHVVTELGVSAATAEAGLGAVFTMLRMTLHAYEFEKLEASECRIGEWVGKTLIGGGHTGEMLALAGPRALTRNLGAAGFSVEHADRLVSIVFDRMEERLPEDLADRIRMTRPAVAG